MKMLSRYNRATLVSTVIIFLLSGAAFYFLLHYILIRQVDEDLRIERREINAYIAKNNRLPEPLSVRDQQITFRPAAVEVTRPVLRTLPAPGLLKKKEDIRQFIFSVTVNAQPYEVIVSKSLEGTDSMLKSVVGITLATVLLVMATTLLINRILIRKMWRPFYDTLAIMRSFRLNSSQPVAFKASGLDEFDFMNETLQLTTKKAQQDYLLLKEFTENASHELQTPLAIIRSKLDVLMQHEALTEQQSQVVQSAGEALQKLTRLNQSLLLLTKIENHQYSEKTLIDLKRKTEEKIAEFKELWEVKGLEVTAELHPVDISLNTELADILLNNLFSNATRYNYTGGKIWIRLRKDSFEISNTGGSGALDKEKLFTRFYNPQKASASTGLGLALIRQIAEVSDLVVSYRFNNGVHSFALTF